MPVNITPDNLMEPPSGGPINLVVTIKATSEKAAKDAVEILNRISKKANSSEEPGCLFYKVMQGAHDPTYISIVEQYKDGQAMGQHTENPDFKELISKKDELCAELFAKYYYDA
ncbi:hypothetical protein FA09DRAFT_341932 [Tilletiopsis washingtonensis]|uniref:ABM domain-containing protein n=1 Tax=Tilletiopsis washingtonensis TaxID=58919 RepID=A0A316YZD8_9BASI|nr:hypothetical protein FA09DRAFT_341932 [Tilletiopsis washingtonensis]PWN94571.1 hypothetical protein FA09DRAFT_341932 [Tilletiopsis washingtonensis]